MTQTARINAKSTPDAEGCIGDYRGAKGTTPDVAAASIINRLKEKTINHAGWHTYDPLNMTFVGRYCTVKGVRSGGYVITGKLNERYRHIGQQPEVTKCLKNAKDIPALQRAARRIIHELAEQRTLLRHRENVYNLAESRVLDLDWVDKIEAEGREVAYSAMDMADCQFWLVELHKFPVK